MFNTYLLIDINEMLGADEALKSGLAKGHGVIIAGSGDRSRIMAEAFGFRFEPRPGSGPSSIIVPPGSELGLTGTLPISGPALLPSRKGARTLASFSDGKPAVLLDAADRGRIMVLPFSLTHSALNSGVSSVYSRLIHEAVLSVLPPAGEADELVPVSLTVSAATGTVRARLAESLPPGSKLLWSSAKPVQGPGPLTFEVTAGSEPQTIQYFFRPGISGGRKSSTVVSTVCGKDFITQGTIE
jgi:hypothetical protein